MENNWEIKLKKKYYWVYHCGKSLELTDDFTCNYCNERIPKHIKLQLCVGACEYDSKIWNEYFEYYK